ncbi:uncharacterized protein ACO6RY_03469 [Pungitius sinensis]
MGLVSMAKVRTPPSAFDYMKDVEIATRVALAAKQAQFLMMLPACRSPKQSVPQCRREKRHLAFRRGRVGRTTGWCPHRPQLLSRRCGAVSVLGYFLIVEL